MQTIKTSAKPAVRHEARVRLSEIPFEARAIASAEICRRISELPEWINAGTVALYAAQANEPDLGALLSAPGKTFCLPRVHGDGLEFHYCLPEDPLKPGPWNLLEPDPDTSPIIPPTDIDLLLIPGLAFTADGARLGRGGGFFDRFLTRIHSRALKVGVCFHQQMRDSLPGEPHDCPMAVIVTEMGVMRCG